MSLLPLGILYIYSDIFYFLIYRIVGYRKKVVWNNLKKCFPEREEKELIQIQKEFYQHLCDLIIESVKGFSMRRSDMIKRFHCINTDVLLPYFEKGQSVILGFGHYNNWEWASVYGSIMKHQLFVLFAPISNKFLDEKIKETRGRYGADLFGKKELKDKFEQYENIPYLFYMGTDQNPSPRSNKLFWTTFLGRETAINFGTEKYAKDLNLPVFFLRNKKIKRGYYELELVLLEENPSTSPYGEITLKHTRFLEEQIRSAPQYWLWTHKRWKRTRTESEPIH